MFRALMSARRALTDHGLIFSIHPASDRPVIYCDAAGRRHFVGLVRGTRDRYRYAEERTARAVRRGLLVLLRTAVVPYMHHVPSLRTLRAYLEAEWYGGWLDAGTARRIRALLGSRAVGPLVIKEWVRVSLLRKR